MSDTVFIPVYIHGTSHSPPLNKNAVPSITLKERTYADDVSVCIPVYIRGTSHSPPLNKNVVPSIGKEEKRYIKREEIYYGKEY